MKHILPEFGSRSLLTLLFSAILSGHMALAGPVAEKAGEAEALADDGKAVDAILAMDAAVGKLWDKLPITFIEAMFINERPRSYAVYTPHPDSAYKAGEDMLLYMELAGYGYGRDGDNYTIALKTDMEVKFADGKVLGGKKDFLELNHASRVPNREFFAVITYNLSGIAPGNYIVTTTLRDQNSDRVSSVDLPFSIK